MKLSIPKKIAIGIAVALGSLILVAVLLRTAVFAPFYIIGDYMEPGFSAEDALIINKKATQFGRGDIVVYQSREDNDLAGRIVGLPEDEVEIADGTVFVNGELLEEGYIKGNFNSEEAYGFAMQENEYLIFPDNRETAEPKNIFPVKIKDIKGKYSQRMTSWCSSIIN